MNHEHQRNMTVTPKGRAIAAKTEEEHARKMEVAFLLTATLVIIVTMGLVVGFHLR